MVFNIHTNHKTICQGLLHSLRICSPSNGPWEILSRTISKVSQVSRCRGCYWMPTRSSLPTGTPISQMLYILAAKNSLCSPLRKIVLCQIEETSCSLPEKSANGLMVQNAGYLTSRGTNILALFGL